MARRKGEVSISQGARILECHEDTVRNWCKEARAGGASRLAASAVRVDVTKHYWIDLRTLLAMKARDPDDNV